MLAILRKTQAHQGIQGTVKDCPDEQVTWTGLVGPLRLEDILFAAKKSNKIAALQVVRTDRVVGEMHLRSAALHTHRAFAQGRNTADRPEVEFTRYLAGERQIRKAIDKMGLQDNAPNGIVVALGAKRTDATEHLVHSLGLRTDDSILGADLDRLRAFGVSEKAIQATTPAKRLDLAIEAVALVDLM
jgi:tRNA threonylcarbamoyladenosine modification (KEOPS) complex Cgi121 subunit